MQSQQPSYRTDFGKRFGPDNPASKMGFQQKQELKTTVEGWEQCLRNQITSHPRIALGMGLMAGLLAGWWIKR
jgi:hypothetical protein